MKRFDVSTEIDGSSEDVWKVLLDFAAYPEWDPNMNSVEGKIGLGEKLVLQTTLSKRAFKVTVSELEPNKRMVWKSGMPLGLFKGARTFETTEKDGSVQFTMNEVFSGPLSPLFGMMIPDLHPSFDRFARGLKARVEGANDEAEASDA